MFYIMVVPFDDDTVTPDLWLVDHPERMRPHSVNEYTNALNTEKQRDPEEWNITDVFNTLKNRGWSIKLAEPEPIELTY